MNQPLETQENSVLTPFCSIRKSADHSECPSSVECVVVSYQEVLRYHEFHNSNQFGR